MLKTSSSLPSETVLQNVQDSLKNDYKTVSEALEKYLADRISEISTIHREVSSRREALTKLQQELEARTKDLEVKEKKLVESQSQFTKERQRWVEDSEKERMEIARQWQQLKDEITRMEELHDVQKVSHPPCHDLSVLVQVLVVLSAMQGRMLVEPLKRASDGVRVEYFVF